MFKKTPSPELERLDEAIDSLHDRLALMPADSDSYERASNQLVKLIKLKEEVSSKTRISPDVLVGVAGNLAGILLILNYERAGVVASKALGFVTKLR